MFVRVMEIREATDCKVEEEVVQTNRWVQPAFSSIILHRTLTRINASPAVWKLHGRGNQHKKKAKEHRKQGTFLFPALKMLTSITKQFSPDESNYSGHPNIYMDSNEPK